MSSTVQCTNTEPTRFVYLTSGFYVVLMFKYTYIHSTHNIDITALHAETANKLARLSPALLQKNKNKIQP